MLVFFLVLSPAQLPAVAFGLELFQDPDENDLKFARSYGRVFNEDLRTASDVKKQGELWATLQQTRFSRAIARFSNFTTENFMRWIRSVENASSLRYEGHPFAASILMTKQMQWVEAAPAVTLARFSSPLRFERAVLQEKWLRSLVSNPELVLLGYSVSGRIVGLLTFTGLLGSEVVLPPHSKLAAAASTVVPGTMLFITATTGDTYVLFPKGSMFLKHQGRWKYINHKWLYNSISNAVDAKIVKAIIVKSIPDHKSPNRPNRELRQFVRGLSVVNPANWQIIRAVATIDGAIVLSKSAKVLDAACMVGDPSREDRERVGQPELYRFPGARSTAAWNISIFGLAIKVSEDGPITVFRYGVTVLEIG
jgi:hypothetical protein